MRNPNEPDDNRYTRNTYYNDGYGNGQNNGYGNSYNNYNGYNNNYSSYNNGYSMESARSESFAKHMAKTYLWMFFGLAITFGLALYMTLNSMSVMEFVALHTELYLGASVASIIFVFVIGFFVAKMPPTLAKIVFVLYAADMGILITPTLLLYELGSVVFVFGITSALYLILAVIGLVSKKDMSKLGPVLLVSLIGLLVYSLISIFFIHSRMNDIIIGCVGIIIFMGFTVYDNNRIKKQFNAFQGNPAMLEKLSILSALSLYLDYINLFLRLLSIFGKRRS